MGKLPKTVQRVQRIGGVHPSLLIGESEAVVQIVREQSKQLPIRCDGMGPILNRGIILTIDQQTIFRAQMLGERTCQLDLSASLRRVAQMIPCISQSGVREWIAEIRG